MVSRKNIKYKAQQDAKCVPHYGIRKLSIGVASVLLGTVFYMQNGTVHADVNPTVSTGSDSVNVVNKDSGASGSTGAVSTSTGVGSANSAGSMVSAGDATNSMVTSQMSGSPVEGATKPVEGANKQANNAALAASEPESATPASQVNAGTDNSTDTSVVDNSNAISSLPPASHHQAASGNQSNERLSDNLALSVNQNSSFNFSSLLASKVALTGASNNAVNGGFDSSWGTLDVNAWKGSVQGDYYQLTDYTGDANHVIVPNEADFAKAGISTAGKQVGVTSDLMHRIFRDKSTAQDATVAFSKTDNKMVKSINADWTDTWGHIYYNDSKAKLSKFDGTNLDVANVTNMHVMFANNQISDLSSLSNWKTDNVTDMTGMFANNQISDLRSLANWNVNNVTSMHGMFSVNQLSNLRSLSDWNTGKVTDMQYMFDENKITNLSGLANWNVSSVTDMSYMFDENQISDLSPLTSWKVDEVTDMSDMFYRNQISDVSLLANWNVNNVVSIVQMFDGNHSTQTNNLSANRVINFVYPDGYTGKKQNSVTQTVNVPQKVDIMLFTKYSKPSNNILDWVIKHKTPEDPDPVYFQDYTVPEIKGLLEPDKTVIHGQQADITKPINVTVTYKLVESNTNDAFALDSKNGLHEHANVNDNGGYDEDYWGKLNVDDWNYTVDGDTITINGLKDGISTGANDAVIVPNLDDFKLVGKDGSAKAVYISKDALGEIAVHKYYGLSKTNGNTFATDSDLNSAFRSIGNLTHADLNSLNTSSVTDMGAMFSSANNLTSIDVSNWDTSKVTSMHGMFDSTYSLTSLDASKWKTGSVTDMGFMFGSARSLTSLDVSKWDISKVTNMSFMFGSSSGLTNLDVSKWDTSNVIDMRYMFYNASSLTSLDVSKWKTGNVTDMHDMFANVTNLTNIGDLSEWDTSHVTNMSWMFASTEALRHLNISNWDLTKLVNKDSMKYMFANDTDLTIIANDLALPTWYQNEINDADYFWNNHMAVITNVPELIKSTGDFDSLKIDNQDASRSIFYDSRGSSDAVAVLKQANQAYIKQYQNEYPGYVLNLAADVDQTDPIALANANFISTPREVQFTIVYYDLTGKLVDSVTSMHKFGDTVPIAPVTPTNYVLVSGQAKTDYLTRLGLNEVDFLVEPKLTTTAETKMVSRTIKVQTPDGQTNNVVQTVTFVRNSYLNQVTKQTIYSPWSFGGQYQFSSYLPKQMAGYTADVVPAVSVTPDSLDTTVNVVYHKVPVVYEIDYQLANGTLVTKAQGVATGDGPIHLTAPRGYRLLTTVPNVQVGHSSQKLTVLVAPAEHTYTAYSTLPSNVTEPLTKTITRTINITMPNGRVRKVVQQVNFVRTVTVAANGKVTYSNWTGVGQTSFDRLFVPKRRGYRLVMMDNQDQTLLGVNQMVVDPTMDNVVIDVKYVK